VNLGGATQHIEGSVRGKNPRVKNSSFKTLSSRGLSCGLSLRNFCMSLAAGRETLEGMAYSLFRMRK